MKRNFGLAPSELPLLPPLRARSMGVLWNPRADVRDFLSITEADPALTANILRVANSAFSAPREPILAARDAIVRIGIDATRQLTATSVMRAQFEHLDEAGLDVAAFWCRQLAVGLLTETFARQDHRSEADATAAFAVGLLHRVGRLSLAVKSPDQYRVVVELVREGANALDAERQAFGIDSVVLTRHVATRWSLPPAIADALSKQDHPEASGLASLLREALLVADLLGFDEGFAETAVEAGSLPLDHPRAEALQASGGAEALRTRVHWFTETSAAPRTPPAKPQGLTVVSAPSVSTEETLDLEEAA